jgi:hypothetical protein
MPRVLPAVILAVALLVAPAAALAQSAGDDQYVDPFEGGDGGGQQEQQEPAPAPEEPAAPAPSASADSEATEATTQPAQSDGATLPRTGLPVLGLLASGLGLLLSGAAVRRKV